MWKNKVMSNLYYNTCDYPPFKDYYESHRKSIPFHNLDRTIYKIIDFFEFIESKGTKGEILIKIRVSENGRYEFNMR